MKTLNINTNNKKQHLLLLKMLYAIGFIYHERASAEDAAKDFPFRDYPRIILEDEQGRRTISGSKSLAPTSASLIEILEFVDTKYVRLNEEYVAEVSYNEIKVGCQSFTFEAFDKLVEAVNKVRNF